RVMPVTHFGKTIADTVNTTSLMEKRNVVTPIGKDENKSKLAPQNEESRHGVGTRCNRRWKLSKTIVTSEPESKRTLHTTLLIHTEIRLKHKGKVATLEDDGAANGGFPSVWVRRSIATLRAARAGPGLRD